MVRLWMRLADAKSVPETLVELERPIDADGAPFLVVDADPWGGPYRIERLGGKKFRISCNGPDGEEGTEDDIAYEPVSTASSFSTANSSSGC